MYGYLLPKRRGGGVGDTKSSGDDSCRCQDEASDLMVAEAHEAQADHIQGHMISVVEQDVPDLRFPSTYRRTQPRAASSPLKLPA